MVRIHVRTHMSTPDEFRERVEEFLDNEDLIPRSFTGIRPEIRNDGN